MRIATWNVNSVRQRVELLLAYLKEVQPDVLCLQELKCQEEQFPRLEVEAAGYNVAIHGQKSYNGVAILSKAPMEIAVGLPGDEADSQSRYIEAVIPWGATVLRVGCLYLPNGNPLGTDKYPYKLAWMDRLIAHARKLLSLEERLVLCGDYNVIPDARDVENPEAWLGDALYALPTREKFRELLALGFTDALRADHRRVEALHLLGLSGGRLAEEQRLAHRPSAAVAAGRRPAGERGDRQGHAGEGQALGSRADPGGPARLTAPSPLAGEGGSPARRDG